MQQTPRIAGTGLMIAAVLSMTGCFTPAHVGGIEYATSLRREFAGLDVAPRAFVFAILDFRPAEVVKGVRHGQTLRDGQPFDEYQFDSVLISRDANRCLRILIPRGPDAQEKRRVILEEFEGVAQGATPAWLIAGRYISDPYISEGTEDPAPRDTIHLGVDEPFARWTIGNGDYRGEGDVEDRTIWRQRSQGEAILRTVTIPVAVVGDVALVAGLLVALPVMGVAQAIEGLIK